MKRSMGITGWGALIALAAAGAAFAQSQTGPSQPGMGHGMMGQGQGMMGQGMHGMMGHGMMGQGQGMMGQGHGMMGMGGMCPMMGMMGRGEHTSYTAGRIAFLKAELGITEAQQEAWAAFSAALEKHFDAMGGKHQSMMPAVTSKTPVERLDAHLQAMQTHQNALQELKSPLIRLYELLDANQKKKADALLPAVIG
jgi:hypothetical protein